MENKKDIFLEGLGGELQADFSKCKNLWALYSILKINIDFCTQLYNIHGWVLLSLFALPIST